MRRVTPKKTEPLIATLICEAKKSQLFAGLQEVT
jgi:hypothetical protein